MKETLHNTIEYDWNDEACRYDPEDVLQTVCYNEGYDSVCDMDNDQLMGVEWSEPDNSRNSFEPKFRIKTDTSLGACSISATFLYKGWEYESIEELYTHRNLRQKVIDKLSDD